MQHEVWAYFRPQNEVSMAQLVQEAWHKSCRRAQLVQVDHHVMDLHQTQCLPLLASQAGAAGADSVEVRMSMVPALVETTQMERPTKRPRGEGSHKDAYWHKAPGFLEPLPGFVEAYWHKAHATLQSRKNGDVWRLVTVHHDKQEGVVHEVWECRRAR